MANRNTRGRIALLRKKDEHFHGQACDTARKPPRKPRDADKKLYALGTKRELDKRIFARGGEVYL